MAKTNKRKEKFKALELILQGVNSAVIELEGNKYSRKYLNQLKKDLESLDYSVFYTNLDRKCQIYHLHVIKSSFIKNA